ncbi:phage holin family protein [Adhaeribacter swui]|uniref:Phage holin family protein n=1 Tax=Adhaeribacter swui TaxID=2086471 RepID=A0A7G7GD83_9BACT|nr:phage holin family protein [Adhaeribacter swui]QNF35117.1 phage holin family protein [Adhaeribacter swui]
MNFIVNLLVSAGVLMLMAYILPQVRIKSFGTALWVAFLVGIFNATIGFLLRLPLNLVTFFLLSFVVRLVVTAIIIKLVDKLVRNFEIKGFWPALVIAIALAIAGTLVNREEAEDRYQYNSASVTAQRAPLT